MDQIDSGRRQIAFFLASVTTLLALACLPGVSRERQRENHEDSRVKALTARIAYDSKNADLYLQRAEAQANILNYNECLADATKSIEIKPSFQAYYARGLAYRAIGDMPKAIADLERSAQLNPRAQNVFADLASLEAKLHHYEKAEKAYDQVLKLNPGRLVERSRRAEVYIEMHRPKEAVRELNICLTKDNDSGGHIHEMMGRAYMGLHQYQKAVDMFTHTINRRPFSIEAIRGRAEAYEKLGRNDLAQKDRQEMDEDFSEIYKNAPFRTKK